MGLQTYREAVNWLEAQANMMPLEGEFCEDGCGLWLAHKGTCEDALEKFAFTPHVANIKLYHNLTSLIDRLTTHFEPDELGRPSSTCNGDGGSCEFIIAAHELKEKVIASGGVWFVGEQRGL